MQEREGKREDGNALVNLALSQRAQAEQDLLDHFVTALQGHSRTLEEQLVGDSTQYNELKQRCAVLAWVSAVGIIGCAFIYQEWGMVFLCMVPWSVSLLCRSAASLQDAAS